MSNPNQENRIVVTEIDSFIKEDFGAEASDKLLALQPTAAEVELTYNVFTQLKDRYSDKKESFFPSPAEILMFARAYTADSMGDADAVFDAILGVQRAYKDHCSSTSQGSPKLAATLRYAVELFETKTLEHQALLNGQLDQPAVDTLYSILEGDAVVIAEVVSSETLSALRGEHAASVEQAEETPSVQPTATAIAVISTIEKTELSRVGVSNERLLEAVQEHNLTENDVRDLITIQDQGGNSATALALLDNGRTMNDVRLLEDIRTNLEGTFGDIHLPEMMNLRKIESSRRAEVMASLQNLPVDLILEFCDEFQLAEGEEASEKLAEVYFEIRGSWKSKTPFAERLKDLIDFSKEQEPGVQGYLDRVLELYAEESLSKR